MFFQILAITLNIYFILCLIFENYNAKQVRCERYRNTEREVGGFLFPLPAPFSFPKRISWRVA